MNDVNVFDRRASIAVVYPGRLLGYDCCTTKNGLPFCKGGSRKGNPLFFVLSSATGELTLLNWSWVVADKDAVFPWEGCARLGCGRESSTPRGELGCRFGVYS